jgi:phosphoglycolate phosphatase (TIGR01487 family)
MTRFAALASDYDGTLAHNGTVDDAAIKALENFRQSGRKTVLVTGRELNDLQSVLARFDLFDCIVAENGAVLYTPASREKQVLAAPPKQQFLDELERRRVSNISVGDVIVATWEPNETDVLNIIRDLGLELQVVFNKGAVMVLPTGVNKKSGLQAALDSLGLSAHNVVGIGDAENDHAFLEYCEFSAAVANALVSVKETADYTTTERNGAGVAELIHMILNRELPATPRRALPLGAEDGRIVSIPAFGSSLLVGGASGSGKSTFIAGWLETLAQHEYQFCLIDPEGDYQAFPKTIAIGDEKHAPSIDQLMLALQKPSAQLIVNLMGVSIADRPKFLDQLLPRLLEMRARTGRPHWIIIDEAHHMLPPEWTLPASEITGGLENMILITVHPDHVAPIALRAVDTVLAVGSDPHEVFDAFAKMLGLQTAEDRHGQLAAGEILAWLISGNETHRLRFRFSQTERVRHQRNYSAGDLGADKSFYFRGPEDKLNLRAQNLTMFVQLADGVDDETWNYHLVRGDYSRWFREAIKDDDLANEAAQYERPKKLSPRESREGIKSAVERRYTAPV